MTTTITILLTSVFATAFISGVLSLGGGSILMGIFGWILPISTAMILHGITQAAANASRSWIYRDHIQWHILGYYFIGASTYHRTHFPTYHHYIHAVSQ